MQGRVRGIPGCPIERVSANHVAEYPEDGKFTGRRSNSLPNWPWSFNLMPGH